MSRITVSITEGATTVTVDGQDVSVTAPEQAGRSTGLVQGGLYRSTTGRTWLYDPQTDADLPWVRVLDKHGKASGALIGKRYADTQDDVSFPVTALTEGATISR